MGSRAKRNQFFLQGREQPQNRKASNRQAARSTKQREGRGTGTRGGYRGRYRGRMSAPGQVKGGASEIDRLIDKIK